MTRTRKIARTTEERHLLKIAEATLRMPEEMLGVMGGMTKAEAEKIARKWTPETARRRVGGTFGT